MAVSARGSVWADEPCVCLEVYVGIFTIRNLCGSLCGASIGLVSELQVGSRGCGSFFSDSFLGILQFLLFNVPGVADCSENGQ